MYQTHSLSRNTAGERSAVGSWSPSKHSDRTRYFVLFHLTFQKKGRMKLASITKKPLQSLTRSPACWRSLWRTPPRIFTKAVSWTIILCPPPTYPHHSSPSILFLLVAYDADEREEKLEHRANAAESRIKELGGWPSFSAASCQWIIIDPDTKNRILRTQPVGSKV